MHFLGQPFLGFMTKTEVFTLYFTQYVYGRPKCIINFIIFAISFLHARLCLTCIFCRGYPLLFQFLVSIQIAAMMGKVLFQYFLTHFYFFFSFLINFLYSDYLILILSDMKAALPLEFPDGTTPVTCRVSIYDSSTDKKVGVGSLMDKATAPPLPVGSLYMEEVHVKV
jgi:hypothetical protein